ncbi:hypothetical protein CTAYLR_005798 [Chrysophaeum taylorii]|uniref:Uncharacterized protein n=1 Tax=Chrysophaeum taylorii TaxID=2483200 RepID=A0AAD7UM72_9STRA|nr:hypothetical protein CTAYLR_005798 [Chrysophaeum taylorii]
MTLWGPFAIALQYLRVAGIELAVGESYDVSCGVRVAETTYVNAIADQREVVIRKLDILRDSDLPEFVFNHLPKASGASFARYLMERAAEICHAPVCWHPFDTPNGAVAEVKASRCSAIFGHLNYGIAGPSRIYVTVLREPLDRHISLYYFVRRTKKHFMNAITTKLSLKEFVTVPGFLHIGYQYFNQQTNMICGGCIRSNNASVLLDDWPVLRAQANIDKYFLAAGVLEDPQQTWTALNRALPVWFPSDKRLPHLNAMPNNASERPPGRESLSDSALRTFASLTSHDHLLYTWARQRLLAKFFLPHLPLANSDDAP